jgi:hypothetical protein
VPALQIGAPGLGHGWKTGLQPASTYGAHAFVASPETNAAEALLVISGHWAPHHPDFATVSCSQSTSSVHAELAAVKTDTSDEAALSIASHAGAAPELAAPDVAVVLPASGAEPLAEEPPLAEDEPLPDDEPVSVDADVLPAPTPDDPFEVSVEGEGVVAPPQATSALATANGATVRKRLWKSMRCAQQLACHAGFARTLPGASSIATKASAP